MLLFYVVSTRVRFCLTHFLVDERQSVETFYVLFEKFDVFGWVSVGIHGVFKVTLVSVAARRVGIEEVRAVPFAQTFREYHAVTGCVEDWSSVFLGLWVGFRFDDWSFLWIRCGVSRRFCAVWAENRKGSWGFREEVLR